MSAAELHATIIAAVSSCNPEHQQIAMNHLESFHSLAGYIPELIKIIQDPNAFNRDVRLLAVTQLKRLVATLWNNTSNRGGPNGSMIADNEKQMLRHFLLAHSSEPDRKVVVQLAVITGKIASKDWPSCWPELIPSLLEKAQITNEWSVQVRVMRILLTVFRELASKPMIKKHFNAVCSEIFPILTSSLWIPASEKMQNILTQISILDTCNNGMALADIAGEKMVGAMNLQQHLHLMEEAELLARHLLVTTKIIAKSLRAYDTINQQGQMGPFFNNLVSQLQVYCSFLRNITTYTLKGDNGFMDGDSDEFDRLGSFKDDDDNDDDDDFDYDYVEIDRDPSSGIFNGTPSVPFGTNIDNDTLRLQRHRCVLVHLIKKNVKAMVLIPVNIQSNFELKFAPFIGPFLSIFNGHLIEEYTMPIMGGQPTSSHLQGMNLASVLFISNTLSCEKYKLSYASKPSAHAQRELLSSAISSYQNSSDPAPSPPTTSIDYDRQASMQAYEIVTAFLTDETASSLMTILLNNLLRYSAHELEEWENDPENFIIGQEGLYKGDTLKSASEYLFLALLDLKQHVVSGVVLSYLQDVHRQLAVTQGNPQVEEVFFWDAVYLCAGLGASSISHFMDPNDWLRSCIGPVLNNLLINPLAGALPSGQQLLRARVLWMISAWMYHFDTPMLTEIISLLTSVCEASRNSDKVVINAAVVCISSVIDSQGFQPSMLSPVIVRMIEALCNLTIQMEEQESKSKLVEIIGDLIRTMDVHIRPLLGPVALHLGNLWQSTTTNSPLRTSIISTLTIVTKAAGPCSDQLHGLTLPLIALAVSCTEGTSYIQDEGIELWLAVARNARVDSYSPHFEQVVKEGIHALFTNTETPSIESLQNILLVLEAAFIIGQRNLLISCSDNIAMAYKTLVGNVHPRYVVYVTRPLEVLLLACPVECGHFLLQSEILPMMLLNACASIPDYKDVLHSYEEADVAVISYLSILARLMLISKGWVCNSTSGSGASDSVLMQSIVVLTADVNSKITNSGGGTGDLISDPMLILKKLIRLMLDLFDCVNYRSAGKWHRKLWCLALLSLYPTHDPYFLEIFHEVISKCEDVLSDERDAADEFDEARGGKEGMLARRAMNFARSLVAESSDPSFDSHDYDNDNDNDDDDEGCVACDEADREANDYATEREVADNLVSHAPVETESVVENMASLLLHDIVNISSVKAMMNNTLNEVRASVPTEIFQVIANQIGEEVFQKIST